MRHFDANGVQIAYEDQGEGAPVVLVHGFAASFEQNWVAPGWVERLRGEGRRVIGLDCRGHGASEKRYEPSDYEGDKMPDDVLALLDHLGIERTDLVGYSMGAAIATQLVARHGKRLGAVVLGGVGDATRRIRERGDIASALDADDGGSGETPTARAFRAFAEESGNDLRALAALMRSKRLPVADESLARIANPVFLFAGADDTLIGDPEGLRAAIPGAQLLVVPDRDHLTVVGDRRAQDAVIRFLAGR